MISLIVTVIIVALLVWAEEKYLPIDPKFKILIRWIVAVCLGVYLLYAFGVLPLRDVPVPKVR